MIDSFQARMAEEFNEFNVKLKKEVRMMQGMHSPASKQNKKLISAAKPTKPRLPAKPTKPRLPARRVPAKWDQKLLISTHTKTQNLKAETNELIALNAALQHQMLLACVAQDRAKAAGALSQRQLQGVKRTCLARIARGVAQELSARSAAAPLASLSSARNYSGSRYVWAPRHYRPIGYVRPEPNYTSFVRDNIVRHSLPVRANPFDDRRRADPSEARLRAAGVLVDGGFGDAPEAHSWGPDGTDRYNRSDAAPFRYALAQHPYWAFNNHALKSQVSLGHGGRIVRSTLESGTGRIVPPPQEHGRAFRPASSPRPAAAALSLRRRAQPCPAVPSRA